MALDGKGFGVEENRSAIKIVEDIRTKPLKLVRRVVIRFYRGLKSNGMLYTSQLGSG